MFDFESLLANTKIPDPKKDEVRIIGQLLKDNSVYYDKPCSNFISARKYLLETAIKWEKTGGLWMIIDDYTLMLANKNKIPISFYYIDIFPDYENVK